MNIYTVYIICGTNYKVLHIKWPQIVVCAQNSCRYHDKLSFVDKIAAVAMVKMATTCRLATDMVNGPSTHVYEHHA